MPSKEFLEIAREYATSLKSIHLVPVSGHQIGAILKHWEASVGVDVRYKDFEGKLRAFRESVQKGMDETNPFYRFLFKNQNARPIVAILSAVRAHWGAVAICEHPYMDFEFWDSHAGLYESCFKHYDTACVRFHFISKERDPRTTIDYDDQFARDLCGHLNDGLYWDEVVKKLGEETKYRGYMVLRPTASYVVSRSAVDFDERPSSKQPTNVRHMEQEKKPGNPILRVRQACCAHVGNATLGIQTTEFIQQDPHLGACATASLWVATRAIGGSVAGAARFPITTITRQAIGAQGAELGVNVVYDLSAGDDGLASHEIRNAIEQTGFRCSIETVNRASPPSIELERLRHIVFSHVGSSLPVLLCLDRNDDSGGHVVAVVGYYMPDRVSVENLAPASKHIPAVSSAHYLLSSAIEVFYAHDDRYGPFNRVVFPRFEEYDEGKEEPEQGHPLASVKLGRVPEEELNLAETITPVPPDVRHPLFASLTNAIDDFSEDYESEWRSKLQLPDDKEGPAYLWRSVLLLGSEFKGSLRDREYPPMIRAWYSKLHLSKYIWLLEMSLVPYDATQARFQPVSGRTVMAEYLYDATAPYHEPHQLAHRCGGHCWDYRDDANLVPFLEPWEDRILPYEPPRREYRPTQESVR